MKFNAKNICLSSLILAVICMLVLSLIYNGIGLFFTLLLIVAVVTCIASGLFLLWEYSEWR